MAKWIPGAAVFGLLCLMIIPAPGIWGVLIGATCVLAIIGSLFMLVFDRVATAVLAWRARRVTRPNAVAPDPGGACRLRDDPEGLRPNRGLDSPSHRCKVRRRVPRRHDQPGRSDEASLLPRLPVCPQGAGPRPRDGADRPDHVTAATASPTGSAAEVAAHNPLGKIPALILEDGTALYDSRVICEYLDGLSDGPHLFPEGAARWDALTRQALADGLLDAALLTRYERVLRPEERRWDAWDAGQIGKITAALDRFEALAADLPALDIGTVALGCALGYLDLRFSDLAWAGRPARPGGVVRRGGARARDAATVPKG